MFCNFALFLSGYALDGCNTAVLSNYSYFFLPVFEQKVSPLNISVVNQFNFIRVYFGDVQRVSLATLHNTNLINVKCYDVKRNPPKFCD